MRRLHVLAVMMGPLLLAACAAQPNNPSFPVTFKEADRALDQMRAHPRALQRPLVVIGGFLDIDISPPFYKMFFKGVSGDGRIVPVSVGLCGSMAECRRQVIEAVDRAYPSKDRTWTSEVDVVGASLGGLVGRYCAAPSDDPSHPRRLRIARLFTISSPHAGSTAARLVACTQYLRDLCPGSAFLKKLAQSDAKAGYELYAYVRLGDEMVGEEYAAPPGRNPLWLPNPMLVGSHAGAMCDSRILADIARRLRGEEPLSRSPATPLPRGT